MAIPFYLPIGNKWVFLSYSVAYPVWLMLWILHLVYVCGTWLWAQCPLQGFSASNSSVTLESVSVSWADPLRFSSCLVLTLRNESIMLNTSGKWRLLLPLAFKGPKGLKERSFVLHSGHSPLVPSAHIDKACVPRATDHQAVWPPGRLS